MIEPAIASGVTITINMRTFQVLLLESFRYCLGRMTGVVSDCVENLIWYWDVIPPAWQQQIHDDIIRAISKDQARMPMDVEEWNKVLQLEVKGDITSTGRGI